MTDNTHLDEADSALVEVLTASGYLDELSLGRARRAQRETGGRLAAILINLGLCRETEIGQALANLSGLKMLPEAEFPTRPVCPEKLRPAFLRTVKMLPVLETDREIQLAVADPLDDEPIEAVAFLLGKHVDVRVALPSDIERSIDSLYGSEVDANHETSSVISDADDIDRLRDLASEAPVVQRVTRILAEGVERGASDIHIEALNGGAQVRYRIDGVMQPAPSLAGALRDAILTRLKVIADLDLSERRLPQDGRASFVHAGGAIDLRVATIPTLHGESAVIRILDSVAASAGLGELGFSETEADTLRNWLSRPQGLICVTGPTGSGKTTTLYAALKEFNAGDKKIVSVEDPVEYQLDGVNQVQVNSEIGFTFARALRSLLRHNPNVILVGEIRDPETAEIAVRAAQTGHLVLATLHTNDAVSAVVRLVDMGVEPYLVSATLTGVAAQRLVRTICPTCKGMQCAACGQTGLKGRTALLELLTVDHGFQRAINHLTDGIDLYELARNAGWRPLSERGDEIVATGKTTRAEIVRATLAADL